MKEKVKGYCRTAKGKLAYVRDGLHKMGNWKLKFGLVFFVCLLAFVHVYRFPTEIFFKNYTHSLPQGIYVRTWDQTLRKGDIVAVRLPYKIAYLPKGQVIFKQVWGLEGDRYEIEETLLTVGNEGFPIFRWLPASVPQQTAGLYAVPSGYLLLLNKPYDSFDSRYFGPLPKNTVVAKIRLVFAFDTVTEWWKKLPLWVRERYS